MKKTAFRVAAIALLLVAGACGKSEKKIKIGVSVPAADHGWTAGVGYWAKTEMAKYPDIEWVYATANEPNKQTADIEDMMTQNVDGLVILATESAPITPVAEKAKMRGIYIVNVDRGFLAPVADVFLEGDNKAFGRKSAEYIVEKLGGKGKVAILRGIPSTVDTDRYEAAMEVFKSNPGIEILAAQPGKWNQKEALDVTQSYLSQFAHIDCLWASDDDMALGAERAIREAGRANEMWIMGGAGMKDIIKRVMDKDPMYPVDITYPPAMIAAGIDLAAAHLKEGSIVSAAGQTPDHLGITREQLEAANTQQGQKKVTIDVFLVTPENASKYYFPDSVF
ncbi:MAG TPA: ABC transporter substrate-binding protein [Terriglobia bacterium]|nr:ABC transporter substrate-binding protein [Terriglobia bacterium]